MAEKSVRTETRDEGTMLIRVMTVRDPRTKLPIEQLEIGRARDGSRYRAVTHFHPGTDQKREEKRVTTWPQALPAQEIATAVGL